MLIKSIRVRLIASLLVVLALILTITGWKSYQVSYHESEEIFLAQLASSARVLGSLVSGSLGRYQSKQPIIIELPHELTDESEDTEAARGHEYETKIALQIWNNDGRLLARSLSAPDEPLGAMVEGFSLQQIGGQQWQTFTLRSGHGWTQVAAKKEILGELSDEIAFSVLMPMMVGSIILILAANILVRFGLYPLVDLARRIGQRSPDILTELRLDHVPDEVRPVVEALNSLLAKVSQALEREKRFTDAAAHELRTPLAALKIHADNMVRATNDEQRQRSEQQLIRGLDRTVRLVNQMLLLSRAQTDQEQKEKIDLSILVAESLAQQEPLLELRGQGSELLDRTPPGVATMMGQPIKLHQLVGNLLDNASRYGLQGHKIRVELDRLGGQLRLAVSNRGSSIPRDMREKIFEPYVRIPGTGVEGSGLGLAIVREIAGQHHAVLNVTEPDWGEGVRIEVVFPAYQAA